MKQKTFKRQKSDKYKIQNSGYLWGHEREDTVLGRKTRNPAVEAAWIFVSPGVCALFPHTFPMLHIVYSSMFMK